MIFKKFKKLLIINRLVCLSYQILFYFTIYWTISKYLSLFNSGLYNNLLNILLTAILMHAILSPTYFIIYPNSLSTFSFWSILYCRFYKIVSFCLQLLFAIILPITCKCSSVIFLGSFGKNLIRKLISLLIYSSSKNLYNFLCENSKDSVLLSLEILQRVSTKTVFNWLLFDIDEIAMKSLRESFSITDYTLSICVKIAFFISWGWS